ncbi:hypothetical protein E2C01_037698 [Portunus trituberculatus]|uniref:Uncharacterized protein n=1 Tax=Portunus trituberculatus TaxID=210409 RepID=A0A5B7FFM9_PORTR|nr:hypothetical protein [Portunus trituberculatus]
MKTSSSLSFRDQQSSPNYSSCQLNFDLIFRATGEFRATDAVKEDKHVIGMTGEGAEYQVRGRMLICSGDP